MVTDCVNVVIDGFPDYLHKISLKDRPKIPSPKRQVDIHQVKGRLGSLVSKFSYDDIEFELVFNYLEEVEEYQAFKEKFYIVRNWLNQGKELQFSDEPNIKYIIQTLDIEEAENEIIEFGEFTVKVTCKPFGRLIEDKPITVKNPKTFELLNNAYAESFPKILFTPKQTSCSITINGKVFKFQGLNLNREVVIDSELMIVYTSNDKTDLSNNMLSLDYPILTTEVNIITCTNISEINIFRNALR